VTAKKSRSPPKTTVKTSTRGILAHMSFFDEVASPAPKPSPRQPAWSAPPENVVGATVPFDLVIVNTGRLAIAVGGMTAYPNGVTFAVRVLFRGPRDDDMFFRMHHAGAGGLRLGVELADGSRAFADGGPGERGQGPTMTPRGGGGGGLSYESEYWLWPLPPDGPLRFACAWPDEGVEETFAELEVPIREAAARAVELWPDELPVGHEW
jgi:hypothetical protein